MALITFPHGREIILILHITLNSNMIWLGRTGGGVLVLLLLLGPPPVLPHRSERQVFPTSRPRCFNGEPCIRIADCPTFSSILEGRPNRQEIRRLQNALCGFSNRREPMACCPDQSGDSAPTVPTVRPPVPDRLTARPAGPGRPTARPAGPGRPTTRPTVPTPPTAPPVVPTLPPSNPGNGESLLPRTCGSPSNGQTRIFFGEDAPIGAYPWMTLLGYTSSSQQQVVWACGGALITQQYVLTAGHCTDPQFTANRQLTVIRLGEYNLSTDPDCVDGTCAPSHQTFSPASILRHPSFNSRGTVTDDIALVRLNGTVSFNAYVQPVCLPPADIDISTFLSGRQATVAGWGVTERGANTQVLQRVRVPFVSRDVCNPVYRNALVPEQVCFGGEERRDSCFGDSGGPVVVTGPNNSPIFTQLAVVSFGQPACGVAGVPAVYTSVGPYRSWILSNLQP